MAKNIPPINTLTDTWQIVINRVNDLVDSLGTEIITANSTLGVTGSSASPRNARLWGGFTANVMTSDSISIGGGAITANNARIVIGNQVKIQANGATGSVGQVLTSGGLSGNVYWATLTGTGTVTQVANGAGLTGGPITTTGTLSVRPGTGIVVDSSGVSVNTAYIVAVAGGVSVPWATPGQIGSTTPNSGNFTTVNAASYSSGTDLTLSGSGIYTRGNADVTTPGTGTTGGLRLRATVGGNAYLQFTNYYGNVEFGYFAVNSAGELSWNGKRLDFPSGTAMLFAQTTAPAGWTKSTAHNNKALRVVSGTAGSGGSTPFTSAFNTLFTSEGHIITEAEMPSHYHNTIKDDSTQTFPYGQDSYFGTNGGPQNNNNTPYYVGRSSSVGGNQPHTHDINFNVAYVDVIIATKD